MTDTSGLSDARRALLERSLRGDVQLLPTQATTTATVAPVEVKRTDSRESVVPVQTGGSKRPFFYLHGDWTGRAFYCHALARSLGENQPFYLLEPYSFENLPVLPKFEDMVAAHLKSMRGIQPEGPYRIGGWCNGGLIAYEMALQLLAEGQEVDLLVLMDADGPHPASRRKVRKTLRAVCNLLRIKEERQINLFLLIHHLYRYARFRHYRLRFVDYRWSRGPETVKTAEQIDLESESAGKRAGFPRIDRLIPRADALRQDWPCMYEWMAYGYVPRSLYPGKIDFFWDSVDAWRPAWWQEIIRTKAADAEIHMLPGSHMTCRTDHLSGLADHLRDCINRSEHLEVPAL